MLLILKAKHTHFIKKISFWSTIPVAVHDSGSEQKAQKTKPNNISIALTCVASRGLDLAPKINGKLKYLGTTNQMDIPSITRY